MYIGNSYYYFESEVSKWAYGTGGIKRNSMNGVDLYNKEHNAIPIKHARLYLDDDDKPLGDLMDATGGDYLYSQRAYDILRNELRWTSQVIQWVPVSVWRRGRCEAEYMWSRIDIYRRIEGIDMRRSICEVIKNDNINYKGDHIRRMDRLVLDENRIPPYDVFVESSCWKWLASARMREIVAEAQLTGFIFKPVMVWREVAGEKDESETLVHPQDEGVREILRNEAELFELERAIANRDADLTPRRCPKCGAACPTYRMTCKACKYQLGRAST